MVTKKSIQLSRGGRSYVNETIKAASHPTRMLILETLSESDRTSRELEEITGENRYNLYHHISVLENMGLVSHSFKDGKTKIFHLNQATSCPDKIVLLFDEKSVQDHPKDIKKFMKSLEGLEGKEIPFKDDVNKIAVILSFPWSLEE